MASPRVPDSVSDSLSLPALAQMLAVSYLVARDLVFRRQVEAWQTPTGRWLVSRSSAEALRRARDQEKRLAANGEALAPMPSLTGTPSRGA